MARQYLRLGEKEIPITEAQAKQFSQNRNKPHRIEQLKLEIFAAAGVNPEVAKRAASLHLSAIS